MTFRKTVPTLNQKQTLTRSRTDEFRNIFFFPNLELLVMTTYKFDLHVQGGPKKVSCCTVIHISKARQ